MDRHHKKRKKYDIVIIDSGYSSSEFANVAIDGINITESKPSDDFYPEIMV